MNKLKKGFSFVELVVVISILLLIFVIGFAINNNYKEKTNNTKVKSDLKTLNNSVVSYKEENKTLPNPSGNLKYFDESSFYSHDGSTAFGVHGFVTEKTFPKKYLDYLPLDPSTNQYYAYGKTISGSLYFEIAGVSRSNGKAISFVTGDYPGEDGPYNLIREFNGPDFVSDKSSQNFPYDPDERLMKGKLINFSGNINVNGTPGYTGMTLLLGNDITISTGGIAEIYFTDGSKIYLGDALKQSNLVLANMAYNEENNLFTKVQLALNYGTVWIYASHLDSNSQFEVYTTDIEAAVRGTIYSVSKNYSSIKTKVTLEKGVVKLQKPSSPITSFPNVLTSINSSGGISYNQNVLTVSGVINTNSEIDENFGVPGAKTIEVTPSGSFIAPPIPNSNEKEKLNSNINIEIEKIIPSSVPDGGIYLKLPENLINEGDIKKVIVNGTGSFFEYIGGKIKIPPQSGEIKIKICSNENRCSKELKGRVDSWTSFEKEKETKEELKGIVENYEIKNKSPYILEISENSCKEGNIISNNPLTTDLDLDGKADCMDKSLANTGFTLVAYAQYDNDLNIFGPSGTLSKSSGTFGDTSQYIKYVGNIFGNTGCSSKTACGIPSTVNKKAGYDIYYWLGYGTGLLLDNIGFDDWLKYNDMTGMGLGNKFAIEFNVRGSSLINRPVGKYYLFELAGANKGGLYIDGGAIKTFNNGSATTTTLTYSNISGIDDLNKFYKVIYIYNSGKVSVKIGESEKTNIPASQNGFTGLYIGSNSGKGYQYNDIIDYVKIYN